MNDGMNVLTASAVSVWIIQKIKSWDAIPWINKDTQILNRILSVILAGLAAAGIHFGFDASLGTLTVTGLTVAGVMTALGITLKSLVVNELIYMGVQTKASAQNPAVKLVAVSPPPPGVVVPPAGGPSGT